VFDLKKYYNIIVYIMPPSNSKPQPKVAAPQKAVESKVSKKVEAVAAAPAAAAPVAQAAGGKKAAAPKAAAKVAEVVAPAAAPVAQAAGGKKAAAPKAAKAAAPAAEKAAAPQKAAGKKAAAPKAEKAAKAPKAPKAKKEVVEADEDAEDAKGVRSFKVQLPGTEEYSGRFTGLTPYQAANKALSKYFRENKQAKTEITFSIRESTRGSKRSTYSYNGKREKLAVPVKYSIKSADGEAREIVKEYKNRLTKVKKADVKEASA
jgi:hypothetical protein